MSKLPNAAPFPERDSTKPAEQQGLFRKFDIRRTDGSDQPGGKHHGCRYFVLDMTHDQHAPAALRAYAASCESTHLQLAADLVSEFGTPTEGTDELRKAVRTITQMLSDREWAEHVSRDLDASALESAVTDLHNDLHEANERIDELEAQLAATVAQQKPVGQFLKITDTWGETWLHVRNDEDMEQPGVVDLYAAPAAAPAQPETWKVLPSPVRVTGEILHQAFPEIPGETWLLPAARKAVWERFADRVNERLAATTGEPIQEAVSPNMNQNEGTAS